MYDTFPRFDGMMPFLPSRQQAQDLLIERQRKHELKQVEEHKRRIQALREGFGKYMCEYSSLKTSPPITPKMPPISEKPPDPPHINQSDPIYATKAAPEMIETSLLSNITSKTSKKKLAIPLKYSCDEIYERMTNGLCIFCEEKETPDHQLNHKGFQIFLKECDDDRLLDHEEAEELVVAEFFEDDKKILKQADSILEKEASYFNASLQFPATSSQDTKAIQQNEWVHNTKTIEDMDLTQEHELCGFEDSVLETVCVQPHGFISQFQMLQPGLDVAVREKTSQPRYLGIYQKGTEDKRLTCLSWTERVWEPGGLPAKAAHWYRPEKHYHQDNILDLTLKPHMTEEWIHKLEIDFGHHKNKILLLSYHGIEVQVISCLQELGVRSETDNVLRFLVGMNALHIYEVAETFKKLAKTWRFKFKIKSEALKLTCSIVVLVEKGVVDLSKIMFLGLNGDNQILLDSIAAAEKVLLEKLDSIDSYYKACLWLELTCIEIARGKTHGNELLVAGQKVMTDHDFCVEFHRKIHMTDKFGSKKKQNGKFWHFKYKHNTRDEEKVDTNHIISLLEPREIIEDGVNTKLRWPIWSDDMLRLTVDMIAHYRNLGVDIEHPANQKHILYHTIQKPLMQRWVQMELTKVGSVIMTKNQCQENTRPKRAATMKLIRSDFLYLLVQEIHIIWVHLNCENQKLVTMCHYLEFLKFSWFKELGMEDELNTQALWSEFRRVLWNGNRTAAEVTKVNQDSGTSLECSSLLSLKRFEAGFEIVVFYKITDVHLLWLEVHSLRCIIQNKFLSSSTYYTELHVSYLQEVEVVGFEDHVPDQVTCCGLELSVTYYLLGMGDINDGTAGYGTRKQECSFPVISKNAHFLTFEFIYVQSRPFHFTYSPEQRASVVVKTHELTLVKKMTTRHNKVVFKVFVDWKLHPPDQASYLAVLP